jgi:hypothetical protein
MNLKGVVIRQYPFIIHRELDQVRPHGREPKTATAPDATSRKLCNRSRRSRLSRPFAYPARTPVPSLPSITAPLSRKCKEPSPLDTSPRAPPIVPLDTISMTGPPSLSHVVDASPPQPPAHDGERRTPSVQSVQSNRWR